MLELLVESIYLQSCKWDLVVFVFMWVSLNCLNPHIFMHANFFFSSKFRIVDNSLLYFVSDLVGVHLYRIV